METSKNLGAVVFSGTALRGVLNLRSKIQVCSTVSFAEHLRIAASRQIWYYFRLFTQKNYF